MGVGLGLEKIDDIHKCAAFACCDDFSMTFYDLELALIPSLPTMENRKGLARRNMLLMGGKYLSLWLERKYPSHRTGVSAPITLVFFGLCICNFASTVHIRDLLLWTGPLFFPDNFI